MELSSELRQLEAELREQADRGRGAPAAGTIPEVGVLTATTICA
jgi:hypothetical protein